MSYDENHSADSPPSTDRLEFGWPSSRGLFGSEARTPAIVRIQSASLWGGGSVAEKHLEKIRRFKAKGQLEKAWQLAEELRRQGDRSQELESLSFGLCLSLYSWPEVLTRFKEQFRPDNLKLLCGGDNRQRFMEYLRENPGFRTGLSDYFCSVQAYEGLADWVRLSDDYDQRWMIEHWIQTSEQLNVPVKQASFLVAAGIGYMVRGELEQAWAQWIRAVGIDLSLLTKIMSYLQESRQLDMNSLSNRMQIIRLLLVAGRRKEALQLLLVMGCESQDYALKVLLAIPEMFPEDTTHAIFELRLNLALYLKDPEILADVIADMRVLSENQLFQFKKTAVLALEDPGLQRKVNLFFCKVYMAKDNWESAALLLQGLFVEAPGDDVVDMMAEVLDNYPVLPDLNFMVGQYYLEHQQVAKAMKYWATVKEVGEFRSKIRRLLEHRLFDGFDEECALMLFEMLEMGSNRAGLLAFWILDHWESVDQRFLGRMEHGLLNKEPSPLWTIALLHGFTRAQNYPLAAEHLEKFLKQAPDLSAEVVRYAETLVDHYPNHYRNLRHFLKERATHLVNGETWRGLLHKFDKVADAFEKDQTGPQPIKQRDLDSMSGWSNQGNGEFSAYFEAFQERVLTRNWEAAADLATKAAVREPTWRPGILKQIEQLCENQPAQWVWVRVRLELLFAENRLKEVETRIGDAIRNTNFKPHLAWLYQMLGEAMVGLGKSKEALSAFVFSSQQSEYYKRNRERLPDMVRKSGGQHFKDVLTLILNENDEPIWERLIHVWYEEKPGDLELIVGAQKAFAEKVRTPRAYLDLAHWQLQSGNLEGYREAIKLVNLRDAGLGEPLKHLTDLANLKYPEDPHARFTLGRYYTIQRDVPRAVDTFRNLVQVAPDQAEPVYQYLRSYLASQPDSPDRVHLYGLLIRIALDHQLTLPAVHLLGEFSQLDMEGARKLSDGVRRVLLKDKAANREALIHFGALLNKWEDFDGLIELELSADFGNQMVTERLEWLSKVQTDPSLASKAFLLRAKLLANRQEFDACLEALSLITEDAVRAEGIELYGKLCERFPDKLELLHETAIAFERVDLLKAVPIWASVYEHPQASPPQIAEAFAALKEADQKPDMARLQEAFQNHEDAMLGQLREFYAARRETELELAQEKGLPPSERALAYLLESNQLERFVVRFEQATDLDPLSRLRLEARQLQKQGYVLQAARHVAYSPLPAGFRQSILRDAGLSQLAVVVNPAGERLAPALRNEFSKSANRPKIILARLDSMQRKVKMQAKRDAETVMVQSN